MNNIHPTAIVYPNVILGDGITIGPYCIIGAPPEWKGSVFNHGVVIGDGCTITGLVTIDGGGNEPTFIDKNCYIMKHAHIGHDATLLEGVTISCGAKIGGHTKIGKHANIGLNAVIHQNMYIQDGCMIGMGSVVTKKLETQPYKTYAGNPAREIGDNTKHPNYIIYQKQMA